MSRINQAVALQRPPDFPHAGAMTSDAVQAMLRRFYHTPFEVLTDVTVDQSIQARYFITKAGVAAITLPAPIAGDDDNTEIEFISTTANAHVITSTGNIRTGTASVNKATFAAAKGASLCLVAYNGAWYVRSSVQATFA